MRKSDPRHNLFQYHSLTWDFYNLKWWSRPYEYIWVLEAVKQYFGKVDDLTAWDIGVGDKHPGPFVLKHLGFKEVYATDLYDFWQLNHVDESIQYKSSDITKEAAFNADFIMCISTLEHIDPKTQEQGLRNMINAVNPGGALLMTFDIPGFDFVTDLAMYKRVLKEMNMSFIDVKVDDEEELLTNHNAEIFDDNIRDHNITIYRLFAVKN